MSYSEEHAWTPQQRLLIVVAVVAAVVVVLALIFGYQRFQRGKLPKGVEQVEDLGFGFRRLTIAKRNKSEMGHYPFLFYRDRLLCQIGPPPSISPSGNYAIYQDVRDGKLMLFRRSDEKITVLSATYIGVANPFVWHEDQGTVEAVLKREGVSAEYPLK